MDKNIAIAWIDLSLSVKSFLGRNQKLILNNISGSFNYNSINALMGSSGSGKTTLLKFLNGSQKYCLSEDSKIFVNKKDEKLRKCFINQNQSERVMTGLTVKQALTYSSKLKNSGENGVEVNHKKNVNDLMRELLISDVQSNPIEKCSGGEVKRICIALELTAVRKPNILLIDEPTTGLDSNSAEMVSRVQRRYAYLSLDSNPFHPTVD